MKKKYVRKSDTNPLPWLPNHCATQLMYYAVLEN